MTSSADVAALWRRRAKVRVAYGVLAAVYATSLVVLFVMAMSTSTGSEGAAVLGSFAVVQVLAIGIAVVLVVLNVRAMRTDGAGRASLRRGAQGAAVGGGVLLLAVIGVTVAGWMVERAGADVPAAVSATTAFGVFSALAAGLVVLVAGGTAAALRPNESHRLAEQTT